MNLSDYTKPAPDFDNEPRPRASQRVAAARRQSEPEHTPIVTAALQQQQLIGVVLGIFAIVGVLALAVSQFSAEPLRGVPSPVPTDAPARMFQTVPTAAPAPTSAPQPTIAPTFTPVPTEVFVAAPQTGRGLGDAPAVLTPSYVEIVGAQAPHTPRGGVTGPCSGQCAVVPTISAEQAAIIGAQKPHKVR